MPDADNRTPDERKPQQVTAVGLLKEWVATRTDTRGTLSLHFPIHGDGRQCEASDAWGCNSCGKTGWPCLAARTGGFLDAAERDTYKPYVRNRKPPDA